MNLATGNKIQKIFNSRNPWIIWGLLFGLCFVAYAPSLNNRFMLDDYVVLFGEMGVSNKTLGSLFNHMQFLFYRPVGHMFLMLSYHLFGKSFWGYHLANLMLFSVIAYMFFLITEILFKDRRLSCLVAVLFSLHPINGMLVNYVTANVISTFVIMLQLSFFCFLKFMGAKRKPYYFLSVLFYILSLLSHEMSMLMPLYLVCTLFFIHRIPVKKIVALTLPFFIITGIYLVFRLEMFSLKAPFTVSAFLLRQAPMIYISSIANLLLWYISKMIFPSNIIFLWADMAFPDNSWWGFVQIGLAIGILFYFIFGRALKGLIPFGLSIFCIGLLPVFCASYAHFPFAMPMIEPHWFYFSSFGFFLLLGHGLLALKKHLKRPWTWPVFILTILLCYFFLLQQQNAAWENEETYCRYWLRNNNRNMTPFYGLGEALLEKKEYQEALYYFQEGMEVAPRSSVYIYANIGYAYFLAGDYDQAQKFFMKALKQDWRYSVTHYYSGLLFLKQHHCAEAHKAFGQAKQLYPKDKRYDEYLKLTQDCQ